MIVVTHWNFSKKKVSKYNIQEKIEEFIPFFNKNFKMNPTKEQFVFLDNSINDDPDVNPYKKELN